MYRTRSILMIVCVPLLGISISGQRSAQLQSNVESEIQFAEVSIERWNEVSKAFSILRVKKTDHLGTYHFKNLSPGRYRLSAVLPGCIADWRKKAEQVFPNALHVNFKLISEGQKYTFGSKTGKNPLRVVSPDFQISKDQAQVEGSTRTSVNNYGINDEGIKRSVSGSFTSRNSYGTDASQSTVNGEPIPGAEIYVELERDVEAKLSSSFTDQNGEFQISPLPGFPLQGTLVISIKPPELWSGCLVGSASTQKIRVPFKRTKATKLMKFVLIWTEPGQEAQTKGAFAISGKSET